MDTRITLRLTKSLNEKIEIEKQRTGLSKNQIIVMACKELLNKVSEKHNKEEKTRWIKE